jgi:hypothetical protein
MLQGVLKVTERAKAEIFAKHANLHISVSGENAYFGNAAIEKAKEIKGIVEKLKGISGLKFSVIVKSVRLLSQTGWFSKSSRGVYSLVIKIDGIEMIGEAIGVISDSENVNLNELEWVFDDDSEKLHLIKEAMRKCVEKVSVMASVAGHSVLHIQSASDSYEVPNVNSMVRGSVLDDLSERRSRRLVAGSSVADIGTEFKGTKEITAIASVEFVIIPRQNAAQQGDAPEPASPAR